MGSNLMEREPKTARIFQRGGGLWRFAWTITIFGLLMAFPIPLQAQCNSPVQQCDSNANCNDGLFCTVDVCRFPGTPGSCCGIDQTSSDAGCDDGSFCSGEERCDAKRCEGGTNPGDPCATSFDCFGGGTCTGVGTGLCMSGAPVTCPPGESCSDAVGGCIECNFDADCEDFNPCTDDSCNPVDLRCDNVPVPGACDDGDACTTDDTCSSGVCVGAPLDCDDGNVCTIDSCDSASGCVHVNSSDPCDDGDSCTIGDMCTVNPDTGISECIGSFGGGCVNLEIQRTDGLPQTIKVGEIVEIGLRAVANGCPDPPPGVCNNTFQPIFGVDVVLSWDPSLLELADPDLPPFEPNPDDPCENGCPGGTCVAGICDAGERQGQFCTDPCLDINCGGLVSRLYDWSISTFPQDCGIDGLNAPCPGFPTNDGTAFYTAIRQFFCGGPACASEPFPPISFGLEVTTLKFKALAPTAGLSPPVEVHIESCLGQTRTKVIDGVNTGVEVTGLPGPPALVVVECVSDSDCPQTPEPMVCNAGTCSIMMCEAPAVSAAGPRYLDVTPAAGTDPVAFLVTGVDPEVLCVSAFVQADGLLGATPVFKTPAQWADNPDIPFDDPSDPAVPVRGVELEAGKAYAVQADCDPASPGTNLSDPVAATLWRWGDVDNNLVVNIIDVLRVVDGFIGVFYTIPCTTDADCADVAPHFFCNTTLGKCLWITRENVDIIGTLEPCAPDRVINILDVLQDVDAFVGVPNPCTVTCP